MNLADIDLKYDDSEIQPAGMRAIFDRLRRVIRSIREALVENQGSVRVIRYNTPPTSPATPAALPTAGIQYLGTLALLDKNGAADDVPYICIRNSGGAYAWRQVTIV